MSPLRLQILLHYYAHAEDFRDGDFSAPAVREAIDDFKGCDMLKEATGYRCYELTDKGRFFVEHLCAQPLPVIRFEIPAAAQTEHGGV